MTRKLTFLILALFALIAGPGWGQNGEEAVYTLSITKNTSNSNYGVLYDINVANIGWKAPGNQSLGNYIKIGGKLTPATDRYLYSKDAISNNINHVVVYHGSKDSQITVNSMTLYVYSSASDAADNTNPIATLTTTYNDNSTSTFTKEGNTNWSNCFYRLVYNLSSSAPSKNYGIIFTKAEFFEESTPSTDPAINADDEVNLAYNETSGSISYTISNPVDGVELEASLEEGITWITGLAVSDESVTFNTTTNDSYDARSAEITLSYEGAGDVVVTVTQAGIPVPTINAENVTIEQDATSGVIAYTIVNAVDGQSLTAEITTGDWISNLADDAENGQITFDATVNTGAARTATVTLKYTGATDKVVTVTQKKLVVDYATLPFEWAGGGKNGLLALDGVTSNGLGSDYAESNAPYRVKFDDSGDYIQVKTDGQPGIVSIGTKMIGGGNTSHITIKASSDGETFDDGEELTISGNSNDVVNLTSTRVFASDVRYVRMVFTKGSNVGVGPITIAKAETVYTVSIATDITNGSITVNPSTAIAGSTITITPYPAVGYKLGHYTISKTEGGSDVTGNVSLDGNTFTMPDYDVTVSATFVVAEIHTVTIYDYIRHGSVTADKSQYAEGETVQLTATPEEGYALVEFNIWTEDYYDVDDIDINYNEETEYYEFTMPTFNIIVNASFAVIQTYTRITSTDQLTPGYPYLIVGVDEDGTYYSMASQKSNNRDAVEINATETTATVTPTDAAHEFFLSGDPTTNHYTFYDKAVGSKGFLYAASSSSNHLKTQGTLDDNGKWSITFGENDEGEANIVALGNNTRNTMQYNSGSDLFSCYDEENNQSPVYLYKNDNPFPPEIFSNTTVEDLDITKGLVVNDYVRLEVTGGFIVDVNAPAPTEEEIQGIAEVGVTATPSVPLCLGHASQLVHNNEGSPTGTIVKDIEHKYNSGSGRADWNTIACPLGTNMLGGLWIGSSQEIYSYDETKHFWIKNNETFVQAGLGQGFIYGVPEEETYIRVSMIGTLPPNNVDKSFPLSYTEDLDALNGFNLVGNPFTCNAYVNMDYMVLNEEGSGFVNGGVIRPCDAILVQATGANQQITFSRDEFTQQNNRIDVSISQNRGNVIDNARIRFGEGRGMNKFYLNENSTRLYIPQNGKDYAVVMANAAEGELPVNFKAEKNGTYTITVNTENVDAEYLHLIDNKTGMDTDLLSSSSYTFEAKTSDYASRFKLVFGVNNTASENSDGNFAFMSDGNLVIDNIKGEATLQIADELGRIISTETVSGSYNKALNLKAGLYILNLNGMTQKIVVK